MVLEINPKKNTKIMINSSVIGENKEREREREKKERERERERKEKKTKWGEI